jgi:predicted membrane channel-forming protein YqfA (hemolysin III family)
MLLAVASERRNRRMRSSMITSRQRPQKRTRSSTTNTAKETVKNNRVLFSILSFILSILLLFIAVCYDVEYAYHGGKINIVIAIITGIAGVVLLACSALGRALITVVLKIFDR